MSYYKKDNKEYLSVTTIVGKRYPFNKESFAKYCEFAGLDPDRVGVLSTSMGTKVSDWIENINKGVEFLDPPIVGDREQGLMDAVKKFVKENEVLDTERTVYCDELMYAGTLDGIVVIDGVEYLADWKTYGAWKGKYSRDTKKIKKVTMQLNMYNYALEKDYPMVLVVFKVDGSYELEDIKKDTKWIEWVKDNI